MTKKQKKLLVRIILSVVLLAGIFAVCKLVSLPVHAVVTLFAVPYLISGYDVLCGCLRHIARGHVFDEEFLMTVATVGAFVIGEYPEGVFVMVFYQLGELFQSVAVGKSRKSIADLMDICPETAVVLRGGEELEVDPYEVAAGETIIVRPGEKIPLDGVVSEGCSDIDTSSLTGESAPVAKQPGDEIISGCINLSSPLKITVSKEYSDSTVAKILELVENSSFNKSRREEFLTRFARVYTPAVVISAVLLALIPSVIFKNASEWVYRALVFLVVSCPCALLISVPLSYFCGIGAASKRGILIKGANYLEALGSASVVLFDKTGTLTDGSFSVTSVRPANGVSSTELLSLMAGAEYYSNHPAAKAVVSSAVGKVIPFGSVTDIPGKGVSAVYPRGEVLVGSALLLKENGIEVPEDVGGTAVYCAVGGEYAGCVTLGDRIKDGAKEAVAALGKTVMLTGDNEKAARTVAEELGIDEVYSSLLPARKVEITAALCEKSNKKETVVFTGDGINDAPVLTRADVGIAMGALGSDAAIEAADVVIMDDDIRKIPLAVRLGKKTNSIAKQNIVFALAVKLAVLVLSAFGLAPMWLGVFADVGVCILAILNAVRCSDLS